MDIMFDWLNRCWQTLIRMAQKDVDAHSHVPPSQPAESHLLFHAAMTLIAVSAATWAAFALPRNKIALVTDVLPAKAAVMAMFLAIAGLCRWRRVPRLENAAAIAFWAFTVRSLYVAPIYIAARQNAELCDSLLARGDAALGVDIAAILQFASSWSNLQRFVNLTYDWLIFLTALAVFFPPLLCRMDKAKTYALSCIVALLIAIPLFAVLPAVGPWTMYGFEPDARQQDYVNTLTALRSDDWCILDLDHPVGLITFPSFHTVLPVLAAAVVWFIPYVRWIAAALAAIIVSSTLTTGWHYVVDVLAGLALAWISWTTGRLLVALEKKMNRRRRMEPNFATLERMVSLADRPGAL